MPSSILSQRTENDGLALCTPPRRAEKLRTTKPRSPTTMELVSMVVASVFSSKANHHGALPLIAAQKGRSVPSAAYREPSLRNCLPPPAGEQLRGKYAVAAPLPPQAKRSCVAR